MGLTKKQVVLQKIENGQSVLGISRIEKVNQKTIKKWINEFQVSGSELALFGDEHPLAHRQPLSVGQIEWLYFVLNNKTPEQLDIKEKLWSGLSVQGLIRHWCKKKYPTDTVYKLIKDLGYSFPEIDRSYIAFKNSESLKDLRDQKYKFFALGTKSLLKSFVLVEPPKGKNGSIVVRITGSETDKVIFYSNSLHRKGIKFLTYTGAVGETEAVDFIQKFSVENKGNCCLLIKANSIFANPIILKQLESRYPNFKVHILN